MSNTGIYEEDYDDVSDHQSLYADSPADGYFEQRDHPQETFVENSSIQTEAESKAREAAESQIRSSSASQRSQTSPTSPARSNTWAEDPPAPLDAGPAPPDYAAATAGRPRPTVETRPGSEPQSSRTSHVGEDASPRSPQNYGSISQVTDSATNATDGHDRQWPFGAQGNPFMSDRFPFGSHGNPFTSNQFPFGSNGNPFSAGRQPQRMRDGHDSSDSDTSDEERGLLRPRHRRKHVNIKKKVARRVGGCCKPTFILNVVFGVMVIGLIVLLARATREASRAGGDGAQDGEKRNATLPNTPTVPSPPSAPDTPHTPDTTAPPHSGNDACPFKFYSDTVHWGFTKLENFSFTEFLDDNKMTGGISGNIWISPAPPGQQEMVKIMLSYATTQPWSFSDMGYRWAEDGLEVFFSEDRKDHESYGDVDCMDVAVSIYVRSDADLDSLIVSTGHMNVKSKGLPTRDTSMGSIGPVDSTAINTIAGDVSFEHWDSRSTIIETTSGAIYGTYALRDLLSIRTHSGSTKVWVDTKEASKTDPKPATFEMKSHSGSVWVSYIDEDDDLLPGRDYRVRVESHSGSVSGTYVLGSLASIHTQSGSITADLIYNTNSSRTFSSGDSTLYTDSGSSSTTLQLLTRHTSSDAVICRLHSSHQTGSGSLNLVYPQEWEGTIEGRTHSGTVDLKGKDLKVYLDGELGPAGKHVIARKGYGDSKLDFRTHSGSVMLKVGDY